MNLKLKLKPTEISSFLEGISKLSAVADVRKNINVVDYYNIVSLRKTLADKLYRSMLVVKRRHHPVIISIDLNTHRSLIDLYISNKDGVAGITEDYYLVLFREIFDELDKQKQSFILQTQRSNEQTIHY